MALLTLQEVAFCTCNAIGCTLSIAKVTAQTTSPDSGAPGQLPTF